MANSRRRDRWLEAIFHGSERVGDAKYRAGHHDRLKATECEKPERMCMVETAVQEPGEHSSTPAHLVVVEGLGRKTLLFFC